MGWAAGFSYVCPNCGHCGFVYSSYAPTPAFRCFRCYTPIPPLSVTMCVNIPNLISEGYDMNIPDKSSTWVKLETIPDEIDVINEHVWNFNCPFCKAENQQYVSIAGDKRVYLFCSTCSTIYYGEWRSQKKEIVETEEMKRIAAGDDTNNIIKESQKEELNGTDVNVKP